MNQQSARNENRQSRSKKLTSHIAVWTCLKYDSRVPKVNCVVVSPNSSALYLIYSCFLLIITFKCIKKTLKKHTFKCDGV